MQGSEPVIVRVDARGSSAYWWELLAGRLVPGLLFSIFWIDKLLLSLQAARVNLTSGAGIFDLLSQLLGLAYFSLLIVLYAIRLPRRAGDRRLGLVLASLFGTFAILLAGVLPTHFVHAALIGPADGLLAAGTVYTIWALATLRRSFSILPEARRLVVNGPYRLSRHPLYLGEALAAIGLVLSELGIFRLLLIISVLTAQYVRIQAEEKVLGAQFPGAYADYQSRVPRYLPGLR